MKVVVIGDPHGSEKVKQIPLKDVDLILCVGDLGKADLLRKMFFENIKRQQQGLSKKEYSSSMRKRAFMEPYNSSIKIMNYLSKYAPVYTIFGNVESSNYEAKKLSKKINVDLPLLTNDLNAIDNVKVINNKVIDFNGIKIGGLEYFVDTNWVRDFKPSDFKKKMAEAKKETAKAKKVLNKFGKIDILLCHQPPYGALDKSNNPYAPKDWKGKHAGSKLILSYIKKKQPKYVLCGHMHEGKGKKKIGKTQVINVGHSGDYSIIDVND
jgi:Icc-related predicted phosphoesterase